MTNLKDMPVSKKVILAFFGVLLATIVLGVIAIARLSTVKTAGDNTFRDGLPTTVALAELQYNMTRFRAFEATAVMPISETERQTEIANFEKLSAGVAAALKNYRDLASAPEEVQFADRLEKAWQDYYAMHDGYLEIGKTQGLKAATDDITGPMRAKFTVLVKATEEAIKFNSDYVGRDITHAGDTYAWARLWILVFLGVAIALSVAMGAWLIRSVSRPLNAMTEAMDELARGKLDVYVPHADQADEIGKLAGSMHAFKTQLAEAEKSKTAQTALIVASVGAGLDQLAKGDLTHRISADLTGAFAKLKTDFNAAMERMQDTLRNVASTTGQITVGADEISQAADDLSRRTEQQAASLEETAAALEEITATVKATATNARQARQSVASTKEAAELGGRVVETAITAMDTIAQSSKQITDIIGVIDEIAFQTNLLALNAGVEAARAGDAGRGFAVVASEVRSLAQRSSEAAKQIKALINASGAQVESGVKLVGESGTALRQIVDQVQKINGLVNEMAQAAEQQSTGIEQVNAAVSQMDQVTQQNAAMVEQSTAASRNLAGETKNLQNMIAFFRLETNAFSAERGRTRPKLAVAGGRDVSGREWAES